MLSLAKSGATERPVSLAAVAEQTAISRGYLEQLALSLRGAGLVRGVAGRHGGYRLVKPPSETTIGEVIEATIGPVRLVECVEDPEVCVRAADCECRVVYTLINRRVADVLSEFTIADMMRPDWTTHLDAGADVPLRSALDTRPGS